MTPRSFAALYAEALALYQEQAYGAALDLLTREGAAFPEEASTILYLRSCMAVRVGEPDLAIQVLRDAVDRGLWYGERMLRETPSWQALQGLPAFEALAQVCVARQAATRPAPRLLVRAPSADATASPPYPLLLALHGNVAAGASALRGWAPVVAAGWLLAAVQSSQVVSQDAFVWDDQDRALREIRGQYAALRATRRIDPARVVVAGFSMGGETALRVVLTQTIPARRFILLGPGGPTIATPAAWLPWLPAAAARGVRGYILLGDQDAVEAPGAIQALVDLLAAHGVACALEVVPGLGHAYPDEFAPSLGRALAFVA